MTILPAIVAGADFVLASGDVLPDPDPDRFFRNQEPEEVSLFRESLPPPLPSPPPPPPSKPLPPKIAAKPLFFCSFRLRVQPEAMEALAPTV